MTRLFVALVLVAALAGVAAWLVDNPGSVDLVWRDIRIRTSVPVVALALVLLVGVILAIYRVIGWILSSPSRIRRYLEGNRSEKGYRALTEGMAAIASGDWRLADRSAARADRYLDSPPMSRLLKAQAAQLSGDDAAAEQHFHAMLDMPETRLVALRGLLIQAGQKGDHDRALALAHQANNLRADVSWAQRALFDLQTAAGDWAGALQTLLPAVRSGAYDARRGAHLRAVLETAFALKEERDGHLKPALGHARRALKHAPEYVPAILTEARLQLQTDHQRRARRHLDQAWGALKHPEIGRAIMELEKDAAPELALTRFLEANRTAMDDAETRLMLGRLALNANNAALARDYGLTAAECADVIDQRYFRLLVDVAERMDDGAAEAREWLVRLADAPPPPRWQCRHCNAVSAAWEPLCPGCGDFDGLEWREAEAVTETGAEAALTLDGDAEAAATDEVIDEASDSQGAAPDDKQAPPG